MKRKLRAAGWCVLLICAFAGCSQVKDMVQGGTAVGEYPVEVGGVTISGKPQKAVVLSPSLADVLLALGYETQLAAGSEECTQESFSVCRALRSRSGRISALKIFRRYKITRSLSWSPA